MYAMVCVGSACAGVNRRCEQTGCGRCEQARERGAGADGGDALKIMGGKSLATVIQEDVNFCDGIIHEVDYVLFGH